MRSLGPSTSSSTRPSSRFLTPPANPRSVATLTAKARYPTPCTFPVTDILARTAIGSLASVMTQPYLFRVNEGILSYLEKRVTRFAILRPKTNSCEFYLRKVRDRRIEKFVRFREV